MSAFLDTNILVRHLTGEPPDMAARASAYLRDADELLLTDLIVAEAPQEQVAGSMRSCIAFGAVATVDPAMLLCALEVYEVHRLDFAEAYLAACAESTGVTAIASFDRSLDRLDSIDRIEP